MADAMRNDMTVEEQSEKCAPNPEGLFHKELTQLINKYSKENSSNTPDFLLANFMHGSLKIYEETVRHRDNWYGVKLAPGMSK